MTVISYAGTVSGYKCFGRKHVLAAAFRGQTLADAARRLQARLTKAQSQDRVHRLLTRGGSAA